MDFGDAILLYGAVGLSGADSDSFRQAMIALPGMLALPPVGATVPAQELGREQLDAVLAALGNTGPIQERNAAMFRWLVDTCPRIPQVILACPDDHDLAQSTRANNPQAIWGGALGPLALVYRPENKFLVWHEAMHLLGAQDCYDNAGRRTCLLDNCLMQYVPCKHTVEDWPFLCDANVQRVRERIQQLRSNCGQAPQ